MPMRNLSFELASVIQTVNVLALSKRSGVGFVVSYAGDRMWWVKAVCCCHFTNSHKPLLFQFHKLWGYVVTFIFVTYCNQIKAIWYALLLLVTEYSCGYILALLNPKVGIFVFYMQFRDSSAVQSCLNLQFFVKLSDRLFNVNTFNSKLSYSCWCCTPE